MSRHTVGPWEYDAEYGEVYAPKCGYQWQAGIPVIARVEPQDYGEGGANGSLIAAAPAMLDELERQMEREWNPFERDNQSETYKRIAAIVAAAKGEA